MDLPELDPARVARASAALAAAEEDPEQSLCGASAEMVGVSGAGVLLMSGTRMYGSVCVSDPVSEAVEEVQYTLGEGPCIEAYHTRRPVLMPDLASADGRRWLGFSNGAQQRGIHAAFGFPLLVGNVCFGALNLYQAITGELTDSQIADALAVAHVAGRAVLGWQSAASTGAVAWQLEQLPTHRAAIYQASGMISVQAGVSVEDALVMLRAYAFAEDRPIHAVADDVVSRRVRFA